MMRTMRQTMTTTRLSGQHVSMPRRFLGDNWLEWVLQVVTLGIGWLIWFAIVAPKGQTPAKQLVNVYIYNYNTGQVARAGRVWAREILGKYTLLWFIGIGAVLETGSVLSFFGGNLFFVLGALAVLFNDDRRALWDYIAGTAVRYHADDSPFRPSPEATLASSQAAQRLLQIDSLLARGIISQEEYDAKRREILATV